MKTPRCVVCGESDWHCLEGHHVAGKANDGLAVILCRNCHRKQSDPTDNARASADPPLLERIGHFLLGLAELLAAIVAKLREYGRLALEGVHRCPPPYGAAEVGA